MSHSGGVDRVDRAGDQDVDVVGSGPGSGHRDEAMDAERSERGHRMRCHRHARGDADLQFAERTGPFDLLGGAAQALE